MQTCHAPLLLGLLLVMSGCASPRDSSSPAGSAYQAGTMVAVEAAPLEKVFTACLAAADATDLVTNEANHGQLTGHISAMATDFKTVTFKVRRLGPAKTELRIRVGAFGGKKLTKLIYGQVQESLHETAP